MKTQKRFLNSFSSNAIALFALMFLSLAVYAVDGIVTKSKSSKAAYSNMKKNLSLSLSSGYNYHDTRSVSLKKSSREHSINTLITYKKGNISYILPIKTRTVLQKFKTPEKPQ